jgi:hypothetical protein
MFKVVENSEISMFPETIPPEPERPREEDSSAGASLFHANVEELNGREITA